MQVGCVLVDRPYSSRGWFTGLESLLDWRQYQCSSEWLNAIDHLRYEVKAVLGCAGWVLMFREVVGRQRDARCRNNSFTAQFVLSAYAQKPESCK